MYPCCAIINSESLIYFKKKKIIHVHRERERDAHTKFCVLSVWIVMLLLFDDVVASWERNVE